MIPPFDLFRIEADGSVKWLGSCADVDAAIVLVRDMAKKVPAEYFIYSQTTERRLFITPDGHVSERASSVKTG